MPASEGDSFMAVLSSARELPLQGKNGAISVLDATITFGDIPDTGRYWKWLLNMEEMGYLAIDLERKKVAVEGQFLCRSCVEDNEVYLSGARTPDFTRFIKNTCDRYSLYLDVDRYSQSYPNRIRIRGSEANLRKLANEAKLPLSDAPTSYILALHKVALSDLVETRKLEERGLADTRFPDMISAVQGLSECFTTTRLEPGDSELQFFNPLSLKYDGNPPSEGEPYVLGRRNRYGRHDNLYRRVNGQPVQVCTDIGRRHAKYYCLASAGVLLGYNPLRKALLVPKYCRIPLPLARVPHRGALPRRLRCRKSPT